MASTSRSAPCAGRREVINDPQLRSNDIVVPLEGAGGKLTSTISSPIQVHGVNEGNRQNALRNLANTMKRFSRSWASTRNEIDSFLESGVVSAASSEPAIK